MVALARLIPPSVLPDISPSRGEIRWGTHLIRHSTTVSRHSISNIGLCARLWGIAPLEGEMSGRTEGGALNTLTPLHG
jgi:cobaltochelatase CobN